MDEPTIACSLGAEGYRERLSSIRAVGQVAFLDAEARPDGAVLSFRNSERVRAELSSIVKAESECCSFLELALHSEGDRTFLTISSPPAAMPVVRDLMASFQGGEPRWERSSSVTTSPSTESSRTRPATRVSSAVAGSV
jgi:hypothetical protein